MTVSAANDEDSHVSFIAIVDFTEDVNFIYCGPSVSDLLGYEPSELVGKSALDLVHPDELVRVKTIHYTTIMADKAATLAYLRMRHKDPYIGYILCAVTRTVCEDVLVGSIAFAVPGARAMHNNATASEVDVITPDARGQFEFRRWMDPDPMEPCLPPSPLTTSPTNLRSLLNPDPAHPQPTQTREPTLAPLRSPSPMPTFAPLPRQSPRTALIISRFSLLAPIEYVSNATLLDPHTAFGRPFCDFVCKADTARVRGWIDAVKTWSMNERGPPSDGGFGFGTFALCPNGRDSQADRDAAAPTPAKHGRRKPTGMSPRSARRAPPVETSPEVQAPPRTPVPDVVVNVIFSPHTDGILVILRPAARRESSASTDGDTPH